MTDAITTEIKSIAGSAGRAARIYLGSRQGLIILAVAALAAGAALNWTWLVAAGIAPILLAVAPCAVMCALGLCMGKTIGRSCASETSPKNLSETPSEAPQAAPSLPPLSERN